MEMTKATSSLGDQSSVSLVTMASKQEAVMMEGVKLLQAGLFWLPHPSKVLKYMKRLHDLPVTVDVLSETGIFKTVNSLCRYEEVGAIARNIVGRWKNLVPIDENSDSESDLDLDWEEHDFKKNGSRKRPHDICSKEGDFQKTSRSPDFRDKKHRKLWELEKSLSVSPDGERREEEKTHNQILPMDWPGSDQVKSQPSTILQQVNTGYIKPQEERNQKTGKVSSPHIEDKEKTSQENQLGEPFQVKPGSFNESRKQGLLHQKENYQLDLEGQEKFFALSREKLSHVVPREVYQKPCSATDTKQKQKSATGRGKDKESCSVENYFPPKELSFVKQVTETKHPDISTSKLKKPGVSKDFLDVGKWLKDKRVSNSFQTQEGKSKAPSAHKSTESCLLQSGESEPYDTDKQPHVSYGSNVCSAWQPHPKKSTKIAIVVHEDKDHIKEKSVRTDSESPNSVQKLTKTNDVKLEKQQSGTLLTKLKNITTPVTSYLGDKALPAVKASCQFRSSETPCPLKPKKKIASSYHEEEEAGFTGRRMNSKMHVYSGSKCVYQPKLISLSQQCIRVINNNLDTIFDIGSIPYTVLEPVLEKCTPKQLHRIEEYNRILIQDTDKLWKVHCNRDFKRERPGESEPWRELYIRLQKAQEQRLLLLTENIRSAYANRPKGRQTMMAFVSSVAKPPRDVRKRQEKFGTGGAILSEIIKNKPALYTPTAHYSSSDIKSYAGPSTSSTQSISSAGSFGSFDSKKTSRKKIAPVMAKTLKAFKNRFNW